MNDFERQSKILEILEKEKSVSVNKLVQLLFVSPATVRRDLTEMAKKGLIKRTHGGAILHASANDETSILIREEMNKKEKRMIASEAAKYITNNQSMFLDSSSTVGAIVPFLNDFHYLTIITNGLNTALKISQTTKFKVYIPDGFINSNSNSIIGDFTGNAISHLNCDLVILSTAGFDIETGFTEATIEASKIKRTMIKRSTKRILLIDSSKFGKKYLSNTCGIQDIDILITDKKPEQKYLDYLSQFDLEVVICEK